MKTNNVWFVTGASQGLGLILVRELLARGYAVAATSRHLPELQQAVPPEPGRFLPLHMDLRDEASVQQALDTTVRQLGGLDVVVNNAGYGQLGALEELSAAEVQRNFEVNVFGLVHVLRHATPYLRAQGHGQVFNVSSVGGFTGDFPGWGVYCATKFAVDGLTESYAAEVRAFGIRATTVKPGYFRTGFLSAESLGRPSAPLGAYQAVRESQAQHDALSGQQPGDPAKAAAVIIEASEAAEQPLHLFLGPDAYRMAARKIEAVQHDLQQWELAATATNFALAE
ncbi:SDR family oxidoreductase [Hymenobacter jeollabukensis]|uniref:SDR family oxidoreductase n=1 Tax=Hymenobacter jeollabukensis TaxID=2025313 RepID=A0A5R8WK12_9BACT|nr:SDR family oxidoreductase [Hymenobacter jeollabukensis]TLM89128.1 SDR family oxidoreductase [Hymenobacter jeollabukensis]